MGVYIKGMEMPTKCESCIIARLSETGESLRCGYTFDIVPWGDVKPPFNCPLAPVPAHGNLFDREELWTEINKICDRRDAGIITDLACLQQILSALRHAPTIIPAEEGET